MYIHFYRYFFNLEDTRCLNFQTEFLTKVFSDSCSLGVFFWFFLYICRYLFISHHNVFRNFRWNRRPFSSYCCGNVVEFSHVPTLIPRFVQCVTGLLFRLLLACSLVVPLVTGLFRLFRVLATSAKYSKQIQSSETPICNKM